MTITFDISGITELLTLPMGTALWRIFWWYFGWLPIAIFALKGLLEVWLFERRHAWEHHQKFTLLAIDVPRNNNQSLLAVENMLTYFAGAHGSTTLIEKWWEGKVQLAFSLEIVSIGGYIQFLIHTPAALRPLVETAVYSQYPDAEIYEVEDYTKLAPNKFPDEEYDIWGAEFVQVAHEALPLKTYPQFEHDFGEAEKKFRDPMASLMDLMSSLRKGEQLWYQLMLIPTSADWTEHSLHFIDEKLGKGHHGGGSAIGDLIDKIIKGITAFSEAVFQLWGHIHDDGHSDSPSALKFPELDPVTKAQVEGAHRKMGKMGFEVCFRMIYLSRKEVMNKPKVANGFVGYIKQFNANDLNALKPDTKMTMTSASYFFVDKRLAHKKNNLMQGYKARSEMRGRSPWLLNVEEIATLWHFPTDAVTKAPLIQKAAAKRVEPPMTLPIDAERKALSHLDPIFEEGYTVHDDDEEGHKGHAHADEKSKDHKSHRPGFLENEEEEKEAEPAVVEDHDEEKSASPERPHGAAPDNLPFA